MKEANFANTKNEIIPYLESEIIPYTGKEIIPYTRNEIIPYTTEDVVENKDLDISISENPRTGLTGLYNLGNTCFMNSVFQCLVNTQLLKQYFLEKHYKNDLNTENQFGSGGKIAILFAELIGNIWSGWHKFLTPRLLVNSIKSHGTQFEGYDQHDAQELLIYLLDVIHEDLNRIQIRPENSLEISNEHKSNNELADLAWQLHKSKNKSIIVDLFQGQYQSELTCSTCLKSSFTFEPFSCLSLPLPERQVPYIIILFNQNSSGRPIKLLLSLKESATINDFFDEVLKLTSINEKCLRILTVDDAMHITYLTRETKTFRENSFIFGFEVLDENQCKEKVVEFVVVQRTRKTPPKINRCSLCKRKPSLTDEDLKCCTKCFRAAYCDEFCLKKHLPLHSIICGKYTRYEQASWPLVISLPVSKLTYFEIRKTILGYALQTIDVFSKETGKKMNLQQIMNMFTFGLTYIEDINNCYEYGCSIERINEQIHLGAKHLAFYYDINSKMDDISVMTTQLELKNAEFRPSVPTLEQCFKLFTEPEKLMKDDSWYCINCKTNREATKTMTLSKLPPILIIQLKRFKYNYTKSYKIRDFVEYPIDNLDLSPHKYDLYGVINHFGSLNGGHYTATVRCLSQSEENTVGWRHFDDDYAEFIVEKDVVTSNGYLLFYQRQDLDFPVKIEEVITTVTEGGDGSMGLESLF